MSDYDEMLLRQAYAAYVVELRDQRPDVAAAVGLAGQSHPLLTFLRRRARASQSDADRAMLRQAGIEP